MLLDLVHRHLDEILVDLGAQRIAQIVRIGLAHHAERARRRDHDQRFGVAGLDRGIEAAGELLQEPLLLLLVPVGLLHGAAPAADRVE